VLLPIKARVEALLGPIARADRIQSLWSGYGEILRVRLVSSESVIVKWVNPPTRRNDTGHNRKCRSYDVEEAFYRDYAALSGARVAKPLVVEPGLFILEDLDAAGFSGRRGRLEPCLAWLAAFHKPFLGTKPKGLWPIGTYWHLDTRREELAALDDPELHAMAPKLDARLNAAKYQTLVHGDAKPANFCWGSDAVAAVDFQYVGGGCGMKDVAYLLSGEAAESRYLDLYFEYLDEPAVEREWRDLYPVARADYLRFLAGWRR
jgi:hypothetical protein